MAWFGWSRRVYWRATTFEIIQDGELPLLPKEPRGYLLRQAPN